jgi:tetratricopeptide (TPR) repeat protein
MSADNNYEAEEEMSRCASCDKPENNDINLRKCTACYLVRYCGVKCQKDHWKKHKKECKKRAAELLDELLFKQPESSHLGDCPICLIPLPLDIHKAIMTGCCSKLICRGCDYANKMRESEGGLRQSCPFCRNPSPRTQIEGDKIHMKRVEANDPVALREMGATHDGRGDYKGAFEYWTKAVELGDVPAHYQLSCLYNEGKGVEKDEKKERYHLEQAAISGHPGARFNLGYLEWKNGRYERAIRHYSIAANLGHDDSMSNIKILYKDGFVCKEDFSSTLRAHHAAVDSTKSPQRETAAADADYNYFFR